ncbi:MAG: trypsin-like peptidase domain-containing protein [Acidobacteria bacterium]|nr:trypsin-like peptidase domain-containing protein [Acidobacteriota bacterium]
MNETTPRGDRLWRHSFRQMAAWLLCLALLSGWASGQISTGGWPYSFDHDLAADIDTVVMPPVDVAALLAEDALEREMGLPFRFGAPFEVTLGLDNAGTWEALPDGGMLWRLRVECPGAYSINLIYERFHLPDGATFFVYDDAGRTVLGAFTSRNNKAHGQFATAPTAGGACTLEYREPPAEVGRGEIELRRVIHGYKDVFFNRADKGYGDSGACNINVNCSEGDGWENEVRAAAMLLTSGGWRFCSGALINNTRQDGTPYLLTANHCYSADVNTWVVMFNYQSPGCPNQDGPTSQTVSGATLRARNSPSDFCLIELSAQPPADYNVYYAGWSRLNTAPPSATAIHHPSGDIKKISFDHDPLTSTEYLDYDEDPNASHWRIGQWEEGTTEGGSSGSPLFNPDHRIVGQLHGGYASCSSLTSDWYGKFSMSWDNGSSAGTRLRDWLDPDNTGATTLNGRNAGQGQKPTVAITYPAPNQEVVEVVTITADAADDTGIAHVTFYVDNQNIGVDSTPPYSMGWDTTGHVNGEHILMAVARDTDGLTNQDTVRVFVANTQLGATAGPAQPTGWAPFTAEFQSQVTGGEPPYTYEWLFGDGVSSSDETNPRHVYPLAGTYPWQLTVTDALEQTAVVTGEIEVTLPVAGSPGVRYAAHFTDLTGWESRLHLANQDNAPATVHCFIINAAGEHLATWTVPDLAAHARLDLDAATLLEGVKDNEDVWIMVYSPAVLDGVSVFGTTDQETRVAMPLFHEAGPELLFPYVYVSDIYYTGLTLVNTVPAAATVQLTALQENGDVLAEVPVTIPGYGKYVRLLDEIFPVPEPILIRAVQVTADQPLIGFELFGSHVEAGLAGLPTFALPETAERSGSPAVDALAASKVKPATPTGLRGWGLSADSVYLQWEPNPETDVEYIVYKQEMFTSEVTTTPETSARVEGLAPERQYYFFIRARNTLTGEYSSYSAGVIPSTLAPGETDYPHRLFLNTIPDMAEHYTGATFANISPDMSIVQARLYDGDGRLLAERQWEVAPLEQVTREVWWLLDGVVFPEAAYATLGSEQPFFGFQLFLTGVESADPFRFDGLPGLRWGAGRQCFPLVPAATDWATRLQLTNTSAMSGKCTIRAYAADGGLLDEYVWVMPGRGQLDEALAALFPETADSIGWLQVTADAPVAASLTAVALDLTRLEAYPGIESR